LFIPLGWSSGLYITQYCIGQSRSNNMNKNFVCFILIQSSVDRGTGGAQRTHGTTDPGGVWHPVHRRECLTILLGTYAENTNPIGTPTNALYSVQPAYACIGSRLRCRSDARSTIALERMGALIYCTH